MTSLASIPALLKERAGAPAAPAKAGVRIWGLTPEDLHERYWASKRVQVVGLGCGSLASKGPAMYLLIEPGEMVLFDLAPRIKQFSRIKPRAMRLRIRDDSPRPYGETVIADEQGRFVAIRRTYNAKVHMTARAWLTPDPAIARLWARAKDLASARNAVKASAGRQRIASTTCAGRVFDGSAPSEPWMTVLMGRWKDPGVLIEDIYEFQPGVWLHENVAVPEGVRLVSPAWIGAGASLGQGQALIGPVAVADAPGEHAPVGAVAWDSMVVPGYRLLPRVPNRRPGRVVKRLFDVGFSLLVLLMTAPLYPVIVLAIWLEDGWPPFFAHTRQTIHGHSFPCYKFRTMCRNAEQIKARLVAANVCDGPQFYIADDPRLLRVGRVLRRFQVDELPQFWNVLVGHMSIVGPRPSPDRENQFCPAWREARLSVRPGITGLWQVRRTRVPQTDFQEWIRYDLEYVQHASWRLDLWIMMLTIKKVIGG